MKSFTVWLDEKVLEGIEKEAADKNLTRTLVIENTLRAKLGLPLKELDPRTPHSYLKKRDLKKKKK
jgi:hypothetical protein